jgi:ornithine--oxo-acid transaminase
MAPHADKDNSVPGGDIAPSKGRYHAASTKSAITAENEFAAHNYHPLPVVFARAEGVHVWDPEGKHYLDFLSAYSAVNQGHCHPELVKALTEQAGRLTLSSRAFHNDVFPVWAQKVRQLFGFDMVLPMNTGAEAVETAIKIARKWAYKVKGVAPGKALIFSASENFHGRTMTAVSLSLDPESRDNYGPYLPNVGATNPTTGQPIRYNSIPDLEAVLEAHGPDTAAFIVEPIQGEAGVVVPDDDYLARAQALCRRHNVLLVCDEIQTGIARTGRMLCSEWAGIKPDMVTLGKAISGGMYPVSCVLADEAVMGVVEPGTHGSTYGGNPLGCAVSIRALELVEEEGLVERADRLGKMFREGVEAFKSPLVQVVRGKGLLNAVVIDESKADGRSAWELCLLLKEKGVLAKPTHGNIIRFAPPLVITEEELRGAIKVIGEALEELPTTKISEGH